MRRIQPNFENTTALADGILRPTTTGLLAHLALHEFFQQQAPQAGLIVADHFVVMQQDAGDVTQAHAPQLAERLLHGFGVLRDSAAAAPPAPLAIHDRAVEQAIAAVFVDGAHSLTTCRRV